MRAVDWRGLTRILARAALGPVFALAGIGAYAALDRYSYPTAALVAILAGCAWGVVWYVYWALEAIRVAWRMRRG